MLCCLRRRARYDVLSVECNTSSLWYVEEPRYETTEAGPPTDICAKHSAIRRLAHASTRAFVARMVNASGSDGQSPSKWGRTYPTHGGRVTIRSYHSDRMRPSEHRLIFPKSSNIDANNLLPDIFTSRRAYTSNKMTNNDLPIPRDPTEDEAITLFKAVEERFPSKTLGDDKWYILTVG